MVRTETDILAATVARILIGGFFAIGGANNLLNLQATIESAVAAGVPLAPITSFVVALFKTVLGVLIVIRFHTKLAALLLAVYILLSSLLLYNPLLWQTSSLAETIFVRNMAILGGLLSLYAHSRGVTMLQQGKPKYNPPTAT